MSNRPSSGISSKKTGVKRGVFGRKEEHSSLPSLLRSESEEEEEEELSLSFFGDDSGVAYSFEDGVLLGNETLLSFDPV